MPLSVQEKTEYSHTIKIITMNRNTCYLTLIIVFPHIMFPRNNFCVPSQ